ncbi:hypothetical protein T4B_8253 [Trichinella pseudospiralis]|uniref:Uncharacterized protein n=1 Tax=Trichinella pseudospiralis TaxID=6337 RepID=A0A0V1GVS9_TRIPS|nr:hypothetical protein T4B_8253 [Trichinella pseudospiralis]
MDIPGLNNTSSRLLVWQRAGIRLTQAVRQFPNGQMCHSYLCFKVAMSTFRVAVRPNVSMDNLAIHRPHLAICAYVVSRFAACDRDIANRLMTCAVISMDSPFHFAHCNCCFRSSSRQLMTVDPTLRTTLSPTV